MKRVNRLLLLVPLFLLGLLSVAHGQSYYGSLFSMDGLANLQIGPNGQVDMRFKANHTGNVDVIYQQTLNDTSKTGYAQGTGGQVLMQLMTDDGTANHFPSGTVLASYLIANPSFASQGTIILTFPLTPNVSLVKGALYHITYTNVDPGSSSNFISTDGIYTAKRTSPVQPTFDDTDLMCLYEGPNWIQALSITPEFNVHFTDGYIQGTGYIDTSGIVASPATETFTVTGGDKLATGVSARGSGLTFSLQASDGTVVASGSGSAYAYPGWETCAFPSPVRLANGQTYNLVITGSVFNRAIQKASSYNANMKEAFTDGHFSGNSAYDIEFYFTLSSSGAPAAPTGLHIVQ